MNAEKAEGIVRYAVSSIDQHYRIVEVLHTLYGDVTEVSANLNRAEQLYICTLKVPALSSSDEEYEAYAYGVMRGITAAVKLMSERY